ncbi:hypothetical protein ABEB36_007422 [Hypothenemus hampei]|uniref:Uncharacterized protein n=1 Tax=Hypothenemus hampei TaxID=57062 RepID=A0ABD1EU63_HYPHA
MQKEDLKIIYDDDYINFRENFQSTLNDHYSLNKNEHNDKNKNIENEAVQTALKKLAKTYNYNSKYCKKRHKKSENTFSPTVEQSISARQDVEFQKSRSELMTSIKKKKSQNLVLSPAIRNLQGTNKREKIEPRKNTCTKTKVSECEKNNSKEIITDESLEKLIDELTIRKSSQMNNKLLRNPLWKDRNVIRKCSMLTVPWKRSHTMPVCSTKPSAIARKEYSTKLAKTLDDKTYLYDDGTDIDSVYFQLKQSTNIKGMQFQLLTVLNVCSYICAFLILTLLAWFLMGSKLYKMFLPETPPNPWTKHLKYLKYISGGIFHTISNIIKFVANLFAIPTDQLYRPPSENRNWPP